MAQTDPTKIVSEAVESITSAYQGWKGITLRANKQLWTLLGEVYAASHKINGQPEALSELRRTVRKSPALRGSNRWDESEKSAEELLLVLLLSLDKGAKVTRSQWLTALKAAQAAKVEPDAKAFAEWIAGSGGINANRLAAKGGRQAQPSIDFSDFAKQVTDTNRPLEHVSVTLNPASHLHKEFGLLLVHRGSDDEGRWSEKLTIVSKLGDPKLVEAAIALAAAAPATDKKNDDQRKELLILMQLNTVVTKMVRTPKKLDTKDVVRFMRAIKSIKADPSLSDRYLLGPTGCSTSTAEPTRKQPATIGIQNPEFLELDPGRYILNAKRGLMLPYAVDGDDAAIRESAANWFAEASAKVSDERFRRRVQSLGLGFTEFINPKTGKRMSDGEKTGG